MRNIDNLSKSIGTSLCEISITYRKVSELPASVVSKKRERKQIIKFSRETLQITRDTSRVQATHRNTERSCPPPFRMC